MYLIKVHLRYSKYTPQHICWYIPKGVDMENTIYSGKDIGKGVLLLYLEKKTHAGEIWYGENVYPNVPPKVGYIGVLLLYKIEGI